MTTKTCRRCATEKLLTDMSLDARNNSGYSSFCKACHQAASVAWQKANPEKVNATRKLRYAREKDAINAARRSTYDYSKMRWGRLTALYGVSRESYEAMFATQGGACAICKRDNSEFQRALSVDHDHACCAQTPTCGKCTRGLLCRACNTAIHSVERDQSWMRNAANYLEKS